MDKEKRAAANAALRRIAFYVSAIYLENRESEYLRGAPGAILWRPGTIRPAVFLPEDAEDEELIRMAELVARWAEEAP